MIRRLACLLLFCPLLLIAPGHAGEKVPASFDATIYFRPDDEQRPTTAEFRYNGKPIGKGKAGLEAIVERVSQLPAGTSIVWAPNMDRCGACSGEEPRCVAEYLYPDVWKKFEAVVADRKLVVSSSYPSAGPMSVEVAPLKDGHVTIGWHNYRGPGTPHSDVLYLFNGDYVGRGDDGFEQVLNRLDDVSEGNALHVPLYKFSGRWAIESFTQKELAAANQRLREAYPFAPRKAELGQKISARKLKLVLNEISPAEKDVATALAWSSADRRAHTCVAYGRIVRHDEKPRPAKAVLAWSGEPAQEIDMASTATFTLDGVELGSDTAAFATAMDKLAQLPAGSVIHVRVCLRTKGPFLCPLTYEGHRHFERTGFEPYVGLYPWLIDVASKHKLEIEWIPDEGESIGDCELNR